MMKNRILTIIAICMFGVINIGAQETEIKISLSEQFFETLLEAVFENLDAPSVPISLGAGSPKATPASQSGRFFESAFAPRFLNTGFGGRIDCDESVRLKREVDGVRTAVRFRNGKILAPIAFEGNYSPPLIGCIEFSGWAETSIDLDFDRTKNALVGNATVLTVNLSGTQGIGGSLITRIVQNSIDQKINPLEIVKLEMLSFTAPIQKSGKLRMEAVGIRHLVKDTEIEVFLKYRFTKPKGK